ncbi:MAG: prepilin-type N-terminal cleavage/methylation domain-containing protein [Acetobacteraceae bacterium]|nr:MAG: prepilin-type N-terminal cleavage/methylation domain-containing protein [Acetobacteraceae bacterium]
MRDMSGRGGEAGFTLLETLVALTVLGFLMVGLVQGFRFGLLAWDRQAQVVARRSELDAVDRLLRRLVQQLDPGTRREPSRLLGTARGFAATTDLGPAAGALGTRDADIRLSVEAGRLLLRWRPHLHATRFAAPPPPAEAELLRGVEALEIAYWGRNAWQPDWREEALPSLVRLRLRFQAGDPRRWPDIVAAPLREAPLR